MGQNRYETVDEATFKKPDVIEGITQRFLAAEDRFKAGDRSALFDTLRMCAQFQAVIPEWAADELLQGATDLEFGDCADINALFGWQDRPNQRARRREAMIQLHEGDVVAKLIAYRCEPDGSFNVDLAFGSIADELDLPRRIVEEIYRRRKSGLKAIRQGNPEGIDRGSLIGELPMLRRRRRSLL